VVAPVSSSLARQLVYPAYSPEGQPQAPTVIRRSRQRKTGQHPLWQTGLTVAMGLAMVVVTVQVACTLVGQVARLSSLAMTYPALGQASLALNQRSQWLQDELASLATPQSLEKRAREQLGYAEADEIVLHIQR
jgi:cell division protein FtsB